MPRSFHCSLYGIHSVASIPDFRYTALFCYSNEDDRHRDAEEYVAVQAGIDEIKNTNVFVFATANDIYKLPDSLIRSGRFDRRIEVFAPTADDASGIIKHYLKKRKVSDNVNMDDLAKMIS